GSEANVGASALYFFFQAEDGIRGLTVTGVQTCALPILKIRVARRQPLAASYANFYIANAAVLVPTFNDVNDRLALGLLGELFTRSEERRVGKGCISRSSPLHPKTLRSREDRAPQHKVDL